MSFKALQTAAARVVHVTAPTKRDVDALIEQFHLHPLDAEGLLGASRHSEAAAFNEYALLTLCLPFPSGPAHHLELVELRFFLAHDFLIVAHDTADHIVHDFLQELRTGHDPAWAQETPTGIAMELISRLVKSSTIAASGSEAALVPFDQARTALESFVVILQRRHLLVLDDHAAVLRLAEHRLKHAVSRPLEQLPAPARPAMHGRMVAGYAAISVIMLLSVVWAIK